MTEKGYRSVVVENRQIRERIGLELVVSARVVDIMHEPGENKTELVKIAHDVFERRLRDEHVGAMRDWRSEMGNETYH